MGTHPIFESDFECLTDEFMEVIELTNEEDDSTACAAVEGGGEGGALPTVKCLAADADGNNNVSPHRKNQTPQPSVLQTKPVVSGISDEITPWLSVIIEFYNEEIVRLHERELITDKTPVTIKSSRDLEDGFVVGLAIRSHCPNLLSPHNLPRTFSRKQKLANWEFLNERVFSKLGFKIDDQLISDIIDHDKQRLVDFIVHIRVLLERDFPKKPVDPSSSNMMLRPIERIYQIPSIINSRRSKRKVSTLKAFHLLDEEDRSILLEKEKLLTRHRICINELESRFRAVQGDIREKKQLIVKIEQGDTKDSPQPNATEKGCCTLL